MFHQIYYVNYFEKKKMKKKNEKNKKDKFNTSENDFFKTMFLVFNFFNKRFCKVFLMIKLKLYLLVMVF